MILNFLCLLAREVGGSRSEIDANRLSYFKKSPHRVQVHVHTIEQFPIIVPQSRLKPFSGTCMYPLQSHIPTGFLRVPPNTKTALSLLIWRPLQSCTVMGFAFICFIWSLWLLGATECCQWRIRCCIGNYWG